MQIINVRKEYLKPYMCKQLLLLSLFLLLLLLLLCNNIIDNHNQ